MLTLELEKTYLAKYLPKDLETFPHKEVFDIYIPASDPHPCLRIRKNGDKFEITKKRPVSNDASEQHEHTIDLTREEFNELSMIPGKRVRKIRYNYPYKGVVAEIGVFQDELKGLVLVDVEFKKATDMKEFTMPEFCLCEVMDDSSFAGGILCGKKYSDIEPRLKQLNYSAIVRS